MDSSVVARSRPAPPGRRRPAANNSNNSNNNLNNHDSSSSNPSSTNNSPALKNVSLHPQEQEQEQEQDLTAPTKSSPSNPTSTPTSSSLKPPVSALTDSQRSNLSTEDPVNSIDSKERLKNALRSCDKEELVKALTDAKDQIEQLDSSLEMTTLSLEEAQLSNTNLSAKLTEIENYSLLLQHSLNEREERITEISTETNSLEQDLFSSTSLVERLRNQLKEAEDQKALAEKQLQEGNITAEKEREYYEGLEEMMEKLKQSHNASIEKLRKEKADTEREMMKLRDRLDESSSSSVTSSSVAANEEDEAKLSPSNGLPSSHAATSSFSTANSPELLTLQSELSHLHKSHSTLSSTLHQLQSELKEVKSSNSELRDECETYRDILQEKTFSGALLAESAVLSGWKGVGGREGVVKGVFGNDEDEDESEEEDGDDDDENENDHSQLSNSNSTSSNQDDVDDVDDVPDTPRALDSEKSKRASRRKTNRSSQHLLDFPTDLASELEENGQGKTEAERRKEEEKKRIDRKRERHGEISSDVSVLQKEVYDLREANKALTLYISKIIDRIVAKEGYESVLAADDDRAGKKAAGVGSMRRKAQVSRPSALPTSPSQASTEEQNRARASKRQSGGILSLVGRATGVTDSSSPTNPNPTSPSLIQGQGQKRRTASIDWRSIFPGALTSSSSSSDPNSNPNLRPFSLQGGIPSGVGNRASMSAASPSSIARRLAPTEEIEDATDKAERERIRAELEEQGITPPENQLRPNIIRPAAHSSNTSSSSSGIGAFFQRVVSGSSSSTAESPATLSLNTQSPMMRSPSFDGPKLTTFDDPSPSRPQPQPQMESLIQVSEKDQSESVARSREEKRSQALETGNESLTEYIKPVRVGRHSDRSASNRSSISRSSSIGGDESYGLPN